MLEEGARRALTRAGETDEAQSAARASLLATLVLGVNLVSKTTGGDSTEISRLIESMEAQVQGWRAAS